MGSSATLSESLIPSLSGRLAGAHQTLKISSSFLTLKTAPLTFPLSPPQTILSPTKAQITSSQILSATPFLNLRTHLPPPVLAGSSHIGAIGERKRLKSQIRFDWVGGEGGGGREKRVEEVWIEEGSWEGGVRCARKG